MRIVQLCLAGLIAIAAAAPACAERVEHPGVISPAALGYLDADGITFVPITLNTPLPVTGGTGGGGGGGLTCTVIPPGDASWTAGNAYALPCTQTGRLRVGLSSAAQEGAAVAGYSDLVGALGADGFQHALVLDLLKRLLVDDPQNASFSKRTTLAAGTDYTASAFRGIEVTCSGAATLSLTLAGESSASSINLVGGSTYQIAYVPKSIAAVPSGCVLRGLN